jgi:single-strand DNA-binding protein
MNSVQLIGRLTRDPELRETNGGTTVCRLGLAIQRRERDADPVYVEVKAFNAQARSCADYLAKGREVAVTGRLETDKWQADDGTNRSLTYVIAQSVDFLRRPAEAAPESAVSEPVAAAATPAGEVAAPAIA